MLPEACLGCPLYEEHKTLVPDHNPKGAEMHVVQLSPSPKALSFSRPDTSDLLKHLRLSGVETHSSGYLVRCKAPGRPLKNPTAWTKKIMAAATHCHNAHASFDKSLPIVTVGKEVFNFYSGGQDTYLWRGFRYTTTEEDDATREAVPKTAEAVPTLSTLRALDSPVKPDAATINAACEKAVGDDAITEDR